MHLAKRAALVAAVLSVSAGLAACKKKEKDGEKKTDPTAKVDDQGSGSASGSGSGSATPDKKEEPAALKGFQAAMASGGKPESGSLGGVGGGMGIGAKLGGLFGAAKTEEAAAPAPTAQDVDRHAMGSGQSPEANTVAEDQPPPPDDEPSEHKEIKFPPAGQAGGDCGAVTDRLMLILTQMEDDIPKDMIPQVHDQLVTMCTDQKWPQELKDCALAAMSEADLDACEKYVPEGMEETGEPPDEDGDGDYEPGEDYPAEPPKPVPAWTGGDDCNAVGERMVQLATAQMGAEMEGEYAQEMKDALAEAQQQLVTMCTDGKWSDEVRKCILAAGTIDEAGGCMDKLAEM